MKALKILAIVLGVYVAIVVAFESMIGIMQPQDGSSLVIVTTDSDGNASDRVLQHMETDGRVYVSANHWPRAWYNQALENPEVEAEIAGETGAYRAVLVSGDEHERVEIEHPHPLTFRILTGFPPRRVLRLDPRDG